MSLDANNRQGGTRSPFRKNQEIAGKITGPRKWTDSSPTIHTTNNSEQLNHHQRQLSAYGSSLGGDSRSASPSNYNATSPTHNNNNGGGGGFGSPTHLHSIGGGGGVSPHGGTSPSRTPHPPRCQSSDNASPSHQSRLNGNSNMNPRGGGNDGNGDYYGGLGAGGGNGELQRTRTPEPLPRGYHGNDRAQQALDQHSNYNPVFGGVGNGGGGGGGVGSAQAYTQQQQYGGSPTYSNGGGAQGGGGFVRNLQPIDQTLSSPEQRILLPIVTIGPTCPSDLVNHVQSNYLEAQKTYLPTIVYTSTTTYTSEQNY